jgi:uncharacterized membrane protein
MEKYSFKKGLSKASLYTLTAVGTLVAFAGMSDVTVWSLVEDYLKPMIGSLTVGGLITLAINYVRFKQLK